MSYTIEGDITIDGAGICGHPVPAVLTGDRVLGSPTPGHRFNAKSGGAVRDLAAKNVGILAGIAGVVNGLTVEAVSAENAHRVIETDAGSTLNGLVVRNVSALYMARGFARIRNGDNLLFEDLLVDFGPWSDDPPLPSPSYVGKVDQIMIGIHLGEGGTVTNAVIRNAVFRNAWSPSVPKVYRQGDGLAFEGGCRGALVEDVECSDNTDGGFDIKGPDHVFRRIVTARNKRNVRWWMTNGLVDGWESSEPTGDCHLNLVGDATGTIRNVTFYSAVANKPFVVIDHNSGKLVTIESYRCRYLQADGSWSPVPLPGQLRERRASNGGLAWGVNLDTGVTGPPPGTGKI